MKSLTNGLALSMWGVIFHSLLFHFTSQPHIVAPLQLCLSFAELIFAFLRVHFFSFYTYLLMDFCVFWSCTIYSAILFSFLIWMKFPSLLIMALLCSMVLVAVKFQRVQLVLISQLSWNFPRFQYGTYKSSYVDEHLPHPQNTKLKRK